MSHNTLTLLTDEQIYKYSMKAPERGYPLLPVGRRLTIPREQWYQMVAVGEIVIPDDPRYYITDHPNRVLSKKPEQVRAPITVDNPPTPEQEAQWDIMGLKRDTLRRPLHRRAEQLLTTPGVGMYTGPGFHYSEGPQRMGNLLFRVLREGRPHYALSCSIRARGPVWGAPGGYFDYYERQDRDIRDTALHEAYEECGIPRELCNQMTFLEEVQTEPKGFKRDTLHAWGEESFSSVYNLDDSNPDLRRLQLHPIDTEEAIATEFWDLPTIHRRKEDIMSTHYEMIQDNERRLRDVLRVL